MNRDPYRLQSSNLTAARFSPTWIGLGLMALFFFAAQLNADPAKRIVRVSNAQLATKLLQQGHRVIADYGGYKIMEVDASSADLKGAKDGIEDCDHYNRIELRSGAIDTSGSAQTPATQALNTFTGKRLHLVQFAGPIKPEWMQQLRASGAKIVTYLPQNAYLIYGDHSSLSSVQQFAQTAPHVKWNGAFLAEHKIHPMIAHAASQQGAQSGSALYAIQLVADAESNAATLSLIDQFRNEPVRKQHNVMQYLNVIVRLPAASVSQIAAQPDVVSVLPYSDPTLFDERQDIIVAGMLNSSGRPAAPGYLEWLNSIGFAQSDFDFSRLAIDITDSGIDNGTTRPNHPGLYEPPIPPGTNPISRVIYNRVFGRPSTNFSTLAGCDGHGTINAHIMVGYSDQTNFPFADNNGYRYGLGVCPFARIGSSVIFDPTNFTNPNFSDIQARAFEDGARISGNSWGNSNPTNFGDYTLQSQEYDFYVRDAQGAASLLPTPGNQEMVIVFAAGNSGPTALTVSPPATAKNVIAVGAAENVQLFGLPDKSGVDDRGANNANDIIYFSSRGPCSDGRMKPDLVAPGTHVSGGAPQADMPATNGTALSCFNGAGVSGGPNPPGVFTNNFFPDGQQLYTACSGTSQACPAVAGGAALVYQNFRNYGIFNPSPALVKAYLINSARYMTGQDAGDTLWSPNQGMGEMDLGNAFNNSPRILRNQDSQEVFTQSGQTRVITGQIVDPNQSLRVTLAWTDAPGNTFGHAYVNDLDLEVVIGGETYKGNVFIGNFSFTGGAADAKNNVESIFLPPGFTGEFAIRIIGANINSDAINLDSFGPPQQDFALVVQNASELPAPAIKVASDVLIAESGGVSNQSVDSGETVTFRVFLENGGTIATTNLTATLVASNGVTNPSAAQNYGALAPNASPVSRNFTFTANAGCGSNITAVLHLTDGGVDLGYVSFNVHVGFLFGRTFGPFGNPNLVNIRDFDDALPYPSTILVSGMTSAVERVTVTLTNLSHTSFSDLEVLLVSPDGTPVVLIANAGIGSVVNSATFTFDDQAFDPLPRKGSIFAGTYQPTDYSLGFLFFDSPAPFPPYGHKMGDFTGLNPNGTWSLYVIDNSPNHSGNIGGGWGLTFFNTYSVCNQQFADLSVSQTATPTRAITGEFINYNITVFNGGPNASTPATLTETLPANVAITKVAASQGSYVASSNIVTFSLGAMPVGSSASAQITVTPTYSHTMTAVATISAVSFDPNPFNNSSSVTTFYGKSVGNPNTIFIRDLTNALPYPSTINVSGVTGYVNRVTVSLTNFSHGYPRDVDIILVGPHGQKAYVMSDVGPGSTVTNINLTLDDLASGPLLQSINPSGTYLPSNFDTDTDAFASPAPAGPYPTNFSVFKGVDPNGTWSLYVRDDGRDSSGSISGWELGFYIGNNITNDMGVGITANPEPVARGDTLTYVTTVTNRGPQDAVTVTVTNSMPDTVDIQSVSASQGSYIVAGTNVIWFLGGLANQATAAITIRTVPSALGTISASATVITDDIDPNPTNNIAYRSSTVTVPPNSTISLTPIIIPQSGPASIYPSTITLSGVTGVVGKVTVTLNRLSHTFLQDLDIVLVGPNNVGVILMSQVGGFSSISGQTFVFDDAAPDYLSPPIFSGTYKPTSLSTGLIMPDPAPPGPYATNLWAFRGISPNGDWSLYINDSSPPDSGSLDGWSFQLTFEPTLSVVRSGTQVVLSWSTNSAGFNLEGNSNLTSNVWFPIITPPVVVGNQFIVTDGISTTNGTRRYYRLKQ